ncbi:hypothetical protein [Burkholderia sp. F1]|uniref:hypothetical protein n=1 Tax=Burkholderia sp. F1 TaxID=3366817 RepID=UPI003D739284
MKQAWMAVAAALLLSACAIPQAEFDSEKLGAIKTIAVAVPRQHYTAASSSGPIVIPGGGLIAAAIGRAISGGVNASTDKRSVTFDELVSTKLGDTHFNRRFVDAIEAGLRSEGFVVSETDLSQQGMPNALFENGAVKLEGQPYRAADAILVLMWSASGADIFTERLRLLPDCIEAIDFNTIFIGLTTRPERRLCADSDQHG